MKLQTRHTEKAVRIGTVKFSAITLGQQDTN